MLNKLKRRPLLLTFIAVLLLSIVFRFWQLGSIPVGLYWDEIAMYVDAKMIAATGKDMHGNFALQAIFPSYGDFKLPVYIWLASITFKVLGASDLALRLPSAVAGVGQCVLLFLFLREVSPTSLSQKNKKILGIVGALILAVSPWSVLFSRTGFEGHVGQFLVTASVYCLFLSQRSKKWLVGAVLLGAASVYSYYSVRFVWPVLLGSYWLLFQFNLTKGKETLKSAGLFILCFFIWAVTLIPLLRSPFYADSERFRLSTTSLLDLTPYNIQSNVYSELSGNNLISRIFYHQRILQARDILKQYADHLDIRYLFISGDSNLRHGTGLHGLFLISTLPFLVLGLYVVFQRRPKLFFFLLIWWGIALLPASIPLDTPHALRSLNALSPVVIFMAFGGFVLLHNILVLKNQTVKRLVIGVMIIVFTIDIGLFAIDYFFIYPGKSGSEWQEGYKQVVQLVAPEEDKADKIWITIQDDRFFLWYLAYANLKPEQIQEMMHNKNILDRIYEEKIKFKQFPWGFFENSARPFIVVSKHGELEVLPQRGKTIYSKSGQPIYSIGFYDIL